MTSRTNDKAGRNRTTKTVASAPRNHTDGPSSIIERLERLERKVDASIAVKVNAYAERGDCSRWRRNARVSAQDIADYVAKETDTSVTAQDVMLWESCRTVADPEQSLAWVTYLHNENGMEVSEWEAMKF